jgi:dihydrodipicolinate synthase/N-acetylneuraminate lyase
MKVDWRGVIPAMTTPFNADGSVDHAFFATPCRRLVDAGCVGLVPLGSLGEGATWSFGEKTDSLPTHIAHLAGEHPNFAAVKESSADVRRIRAIRALVGERLAVLVGVDDCIVEGVQAGAVGWIAGLVNAFPEESVALFNQAVQVREGRGDRAALEELYTWFLPLLRLDTVPKLVQMIKLAQDMVGMGSRRVRPPRLELVDGELEDAQRLIRHALDHRPALRA